MKPRTLAALLLGFAVIGKPAVAATPESVAESVEISLWSHPLPFQRLVDVQLEALFYPDTVGLCLQVDPYWFASVEGCAGTVVFLTTVHLDLRLPVLHYMRLRDETDAAGSHRISGWEIGFGPLVGGRGVFPATARILRSPPYVALDVGASVEWVYWFRPHLGLKVQLDAGAIVGVGTGVHPNLPFGESKIGLAF